MWKSNHGESSLKISGKKKLFAYEFRWCMSLMASKTCYKYEHNLKAEQAEMCFI